MKKEMVTLFSCTPAHADKKISVSLWRAFIGLFIAIAASPISAQQYKYSEGPFIMTPLRQAQIPTRQEFPGVYCLDLPDTQFVKDATVGLLNDNAITYFLRFISL